MIITVQEGSSELTESSKKPLSLHPNVKHPWMIYIGRLVNIDSTVFWKDISHQTYLVIDS